MAFSLAIILLFALPTNKIFETLKMPGLLGTLLLGIAIGPYGLDWLQPELLNASSDLRRIALIIILLRAGLGINKDDLKQNGVIALKMSCLPGLFEGATIAFISVKLLGFSLIQGGILGFILSAVSPAVVVPSMLDLIKREVGTEKRVPSLIIAGASIDDVFAITMLSVFLGLYSGASINIGIKMLSIPISIILGFMVGIVGFIIVHIFKKYQMRDTQKVLLVLALAVLISELEFQFKTKIEIASLLGVMTIGFIISEKMPHIGERLAQKLNKIWIFAEILLFVLVGAQVDVTLAFKAGGVGIAIIGTGLIGRSIGVLFSLVGTNFNWKERLFCIISYSPKATVQAAMGAIPLSLGVKSGDVILAIAVLSILVTAPLGAIGIRYSAKKLL